MAVFFLKMATMMGPIDLNPTDFYPIYLPII